MWLAEEIRESEIEFRDGRLSGRLRMESEAGDREYRVELLGFVESDGEKVTRFDLVAKGSFRGEGTFTRKAPPGEFPLAVSFRLADGTDLADAIPPQGSRGWIDGYLRER